MNRSVRLIIKLLLGIVAISAVAAPAGSGGKQRGNPGSGSRLHLSFNALRPAVLPDILAFLWHDQD
jgi:hypothetical protein